MNFWKTTVASIFLIMLSFGYSAVFAAPKTAVQSNQRQFLIFWQEEKVAGSGFHRPYSEIVIQDENVDTVWEGSTDARGYFNFVINSRHIDPNYGHTFFLSAFDQFGQEVQKENGEPDRLQATLPPGLKTTGKTAPGARVILQDQDGRILQTVTADANGFYEISNASQKSTVTIEYEGETEKFDFTTGTMPNTFVITDPPAEGGNELAAAPEEESGSGFLRTFLLVFVLGGSGFLLFLFLRQHQNTL